MSTRERAAAIFDSLTEEQLEEFIKYFGSIEEYDRTYDSYVHEKLHEADLLAKETAVRMTHEEVFDEIRRIMYNR